MLKLTYRLLLLSLALISFANAQQSIGSSYQEISKKASKADLYDFYVNKDENKLELAYKLSETSSSLDVETYYFKLDDMSFISSNESTIEKEKSRYKRLKGSGNIRLLRVSANPINGKLKLKKGHIEYGYAGRAVITHFIEEQVKEVSTSQGDKFIYISHKTETPEGNKLGDLGIWGRPVSIGLGNVSIVGLEKTTPYYSKYAFTIYDAHTLGEKVYKSFDLGYSYAPITCNYLPNGDLGMVFQPIQKEVLPKTKGAEANFKIDPEKNFKYVQINTAGDVVTNANFKISTSEKGGLYSIQVVPTDKKGEVVLLGISKPESFGVPIQINPKFVAPRNTDEKPAIDVGIKADKLITVKISDGKTVYTNETPISDLTANAVTHSSTKTKAPSDAQKHIRWGGFTTYNAINDNSRNTLIASKCREYHQVIQLDQSGKVTANYFDVSDQDWAVNSDLYKNGNGDIFWVNYDMPKHADDASETDKQKAWSMRTGNISKVNTNSKKIENSIPLSASGSTLDEQDAITIADSNTLLILGKGKKKEISLNKISLE